MILAILSSKGGVGKTTTVVHLARLWSERRPIVIDIDDQGAVENFASHLPGATVRRCEPDAVESALRGGKTRPVLIDCPASVPASHRALSVATAVIVPVQARFLSLRGSLQIVDMLRELYPRLPRKVLLTMMSANQSIARDVRDTVRQEFAGEAFKTIIHTHGAFDAASEAGQTVFDWAPDSNAAKQYARVGQEIDQWQI